MGGPLSVQKKYMGRAYGGQTVAGVGGRQEGTWVGSTRFRTMPPTRRPTGRGAPDERLEGREFAAARAVREPDRHHDRVLRLLHLCDRGGSGVSRAVLPV